MYKFVYRNYTIENTDNLAITGVYGLGVPSIRASEETMTGFDGGFVWNRKYNMRTIALEGYIFADQAANYYGIRKEISEVFSVHTFDTLVIERTDGMRFLTYAKVIAGPEFVEQTGDYLLCEFRVELRCENPFFLSENQTTVTLNLTNPGGMPVPSPVRFPVGNKTFSNTVINMGNVDAKPKFVIKGPITNPFLENQTTGKFFSINGAFTASDTIEVFLNPDLKVLVNNFNNIQNFSGEYWTLLSGANNVRLGCSAYSGSPFANIIYHHTYLSI